MKVERSGVVVTVEKGFIVAIRCSWEFFLAHHAAILAHPDVVLREVRFTTWPAEEWLAVNVSPWPSMRGRREATWSDISKALSDFFPGHCPAPIHFVLPT